MTLRKIIHIDMDCFYAAIEIRDNPSLANKPVAVGGSAESRGVLCTCNYIARQYGIRSAMPTTSAYRLCKDLVLLPVDMEKYKKVSTNIQKIFYDFTPLVEPLSLDEAYLDVSEVKQFQGSATLIAKAIRERIWQTENLTASAGVAPNKFLAKIASGWKKPNGLFVIRPEQASSFVLTLPIKELYGVGKVTAEKMHSMGLVTCADLQKLSLFELTQHFGKFGKQLYEQCRGIDTRTVEPHRERKSISVEHTFPQDITNCDIALDALKILFDKFVIRLQENASDCSIKNQYIKIKYSNFRQITSEMASQELNFALFQTLFLNVYAKIRTPIRLIGIGVHFNHEKKEEDKQQSFFDEKLN